MNPRSHSHTPRLIAAAVLVSSLPLVALAAPVDIPNMFEDGDPISAELFNENFAALEDAIDDNDARITELEAGSGGGGGGVPAGAVMHFELEECPDGWIPFDEARGRTIVGLDLGGGTLGESVGAPLEDLEDRSHTHMVTISATSSTENVPHTHSTPGSMTTAGGGTHSHQWWDNNATWNAADGVVVFLPVAAGSGPLTTTQGFSGNDLFTNNDGAHQHSVPSGTSGGASSTAHEHTVSDTAVSMGANTSSVMPYVQLLACRKQ
jgi:hypothetical protein